MKHHVCAVLLFVSSLVCAEVDKHTVAEKSKRIGRFGYEDSFNENLVEEILKYAPAAVKKNINALLYPSADAEGISQRLLLLGGTSNASTTAIAKAIALRCGYDYYLIEASVLLKEYREGRQMLLNEVRPIIKKGKPIALIITELPEMADYSGLLASTLWMLIDQCAQYPDVLVIGTSACNKGHLSEDIKERFGENIISVSLNKAKQDRIENEEIKKNWLERNKVACVLIGGAACLTLATAHVAAQILFAFEQNKVLKEQYKTQLNDFIMQCHIYDHVKGLNQRLGEGARASEEVKKARTEYDKVVDNLREDTRKKIRELEDSIKQ
jgi:hypothetical protein